MLFVRNYNNLTEIVFKNYSKYAEKSAFSIVKMIVERHLFTYESRSKMVRKFLNIKSRIPIYVNEKMLFIPTKSPRDYNCIFINYYEILKFIKRENKTEVVFNNLQTINIDISYKSFLRSFNQAKEVISYLENITNDLFL